MKIPKWFALVFSSQERKKFNRKKSVLLTSPSFPILTTTPQWLEATFLNSPVEEYIATCRY